MAFEFPEHRILSSKQLVQFIVESKSKGTKFCFVLGAGASVESGIDSGNVLEKKWMDELMGETKLNGRPMFLPEDTRKTAKGLKKAGLIEHDFDQIEAAWNLAKTNKWNSMPSEFYFDVYRLRFHIDPSHGYRYLEKLMDKKEPGMGYHPLAKLLTETGLSNLVITTNFDSLVEDALFLYTDKKPLVAGHEALASYIDADIDRPIVAKVHRSLMYDPFNTPEDTDTLQTSWRSTLRDILRGHTPIVIGYGGGDRSLMSFLEEKDTVMPNVLWCYREKDGFPDERIQKFVHSKNGCLIPINGFNAIMLELGSALYPDKITPTATEEYWKKQLDNRLAEYNRQYSELNQDPETRDAIGPIEKVEQTEVKKREEQDNLTAYDHFNRGFKAAEAGLHEEAVAEYTLAIQKNEDYADAYNNRGVAYYNLNQYKEALADYTEAIRLKPDHVFAHNNRGIIYRNQHKYEQALAGCNEAIRLDPKYAQAYLSRGNVYDDQKQYPQAANEYTRAIELNPQYKIAYENRARTYRKMKQYDLAKADEEAAAKL